MFQRYRKQKLMGELEKLSLRMEKVANKWWNFDPEDKPLRDTLNSIRNGAASIRWYLTFPRIES